MKMKEKEPELHEMHFGLPCRRMQAGSLIKVCTPLQSVNSLVDFIT
jgi:hypothetical protein